MNDHALSHARALSSRSGTKLDFDFCLVSLRTDARLKAFESMVIRIGASNIQEQ